MDIKKITQPDLLNGSIVKSLFCFTFPLFISFLFQQFYNAADIVIVGHYLKEDSLAAIGSSSILFEIMVGFGNGVTLGLSIVASRVFGSGNKDSLKKVVAASIVIILGITAIITVLSLFLLRPVLVVLGTPQHIMEEALSYISRIGLFCFVLFAYNMCAAFLRAIGNSFMSLVFLMISSVINIVLDIVFITKLSMGVEGTAYATIIAQGISAVLCFIYIKSHADILIPKKESFLIKREESSILYKDLIAQGLSMAFMGSIVSLGSLILQSSINSFGSLIIAGHIAARKIFSFTTIPIFTAGMACSTFVSQNYGARKYDRLKKGVVASIICISIYILVLNVLLPFFLKALVQFMSGSDNPVVLEYGIKYLSIALPFFIVLVPLIVIRNSLQSLGAKILPLVSSILELLGKILFTVLVIPHAGIFGIYLCEPLIWCVMTAYLVFAYIKRIRSL